MVQRARSEVDAAMERYADGDAAAFPLLYELLAPRLFAYLRRRTGGEEAAQDLLQQTFLRIHHARGHFRPGASVLAWAYAIARRLAMDAARGHRRRPEVQEHDLSRHLAACLSADPQRQAEVRQELGDLQRRLDALPDSQRQAFELVRIEGLSLREAADVLGTTAGAVKLRAHRAYVALGLTKPQEVES